MADREGGLASIMLAAVLISSALACGRSGDPSRSAASSTRSSTQASSSSASNTSSATATSSGASTGRSSAEDGGAAGGGTNDGTSAAVDEATASQPASPARDISFAELSAQRQSLVGQAVRVVGKVFFVANCPPNGAACALTGYLADPSRSQLLTSEIDQGLLLAEQGAVVSCREGDGPPRSCPGWQDSAQYQLVATVEHQVLGGRQTDYVQIEVIEKALA